MVVLNGFYRGQFRQYLTNDWSRCDHNLYEHINQINGQQCHFIWTKWLKVDLRICEIFFLRQRGIAAIQFFMGVCDSKYMLAEKYLLLIMYCGKLSLGAIKFYNGIHLEKDSNVHQESDQHLLWLCITSIVSLNEGYFQNIPYNIQLLCKLHIRKSIRIKGNSLDKSLK